MIGLLGGHGRVLAECYRIRASRHYRETEPGRTHATSSLRRVLGAPKRSHRRKRQRRKRLADEAPIDSSRNRWQVPDDPRRTASGSPAIPVLPELL
jgi:hypothetical protein